MQNPQTNQWHSVFLKKTWGLQAATLLKVSSFIGVFNKVFFHRLHLFGDALLTEYTRTMISMFSRILTRVCWPEQFAGKLITEKQFYKTFITDCFNLDPQKAAGNYMPKVTKKNSLRMCEMNSKLTLKTPGWRHQQGSGVCVINDEQMSHLIFLFLLLTLRR